MTPVAQLLADLCGRARNAAWLRLSRVGRIEELGGSLATYGLDPLNTGQLATVEAPYLEGMLEGTLGHIEIPLLGVQPGVYADLHLLREAESTWVLLLDATERAAEMGLLQQARNELALDPRRGTVTAFLSALGAKDVLLLEYLGSGRFRPRGTPPTWASEAFASDHLADPERAFPYLSAFAPEALVFWEERGIGVLRSEPWVQEVGGNDMELVAGAAWLEPNHPMLMIGPAGTDVADRRHLLQRARERALEQERLSRLAEERDFLLHTLRREIRPLGLAIRDQCRGLPEDVAPSLASSAERLLATVERILLLFPAHDEISRVARAAPHRARGDQAPTS